MVSVHLDIDSSVAVVNFDHMHSSIAVVFDVHEHTLFCSLWSLVSVAVLFCVHWDGVDYSCNLWSILKRIFNSALQTQQRSI